MTKPLSFLGSEFPNSEPDQAKFHIIPIPYEATVSYLPGTAQAPSAIIEASQQLEVWDGQGIPGAAGLHTQTAIDCELEREELYRRIGERVKSSLNYPNRPIPVILGGEHSLTLPVIGAFEQALQEKSIGIIQFDAHADLRDSLDGNPYSHGSVMRRIHEKYRLPLIQLGVRAISPDELDYRREHRLIHHDARELVSKKINTLKIPLDFPQQVYLSFDLDVLDPGIMPATGTPVPGGLDWYQSLSLLESIGAQRKIIGFDLVEHAPLKELVAPSYLVAELCYRLMGITLASQGTPASRPTT